MRLWSGARQLLTIRNVNSTHRKHLLNQDLEHSSGFWRDSTRNRSMQSKERDDIMDVGGDLCGSGNGAACARERANVTGLE